jgi:hypothetical protein
VALSRAQRLVLTRRLQQRLTSISERAVRPVAASWMRLGPNWRDDDLRAFLADVAPHVDAAKRAALSVSTGYYAGVFGVRPPPLSPADVPVRFAGETAFIVARKALADGYEIAEAARMGGSAAEAAVRDLVISTSRTSGDVVAESTGISVTGWERKAEAGACEWCQGLDGVVFVTAADGDFGHDRCNCTLEPVTREQDARRVTDRGIRLGQSEGPRNF